jgi:hypothetical protein
MGRFWGLGGSIDELELKVKANIVGFPDNISFEKIKT